MKRIKSNVIRLAFATLGIWLAITIVPPSLAWFIPGIVFDINNISGQSEGAYFAGGDGTQENPYIINKGIHVYNLSWLQYIGHFNKVDNGALEKQNYFIIDDDIDMDGLAIPPIGTTRYPFVGNIDGQGHIISNFTITNNYADLVKKPSTVTNVNYSDVNIVGFFGVIGQTENESWTWTYDNSNNEIINLGLNNFHIKTNANQTLAGLAAGYVNGILSGVAVNDGDINITNNSATSISSLTTNISDYGTVGYCNASYRNRCHVQDIQYYDPDVKYAADTSGGDQWGASIAMKDMFDHLYSIYSTGGTQYRYTTAETRTYDSENNMIDSTVTASANAPEFASDYTYRYNEKMEDGHVIASYNYSYDSSNNEYMYMSGQKTVTIPDANTVTSNRINEVTGQTISDGSGNYVSVNGTDMMNTTDSNKAVPFFNVTGGYLATYISGSMYYLYFDGVKLTYHLSNRTVFSRDNATGKITCTYNSRIYSLYYASNNWNMETELSPFYISSGTSYFTYGATNYSANQTNASKWYVDNSNRVYTKNGNNRLYVGFNGTTLQIQATPTYYFTLNGNRLSGSNGTRTYYLRYASSWGTSRWSSSATSSTVTITNGTVEPAPYTSTVLTNATSYIATSTATEDSSYTTKPTYVPLTWGDELKTTVSDKNTGYMVSGPKNNFADIRVSKYAMSSIKVSLNNSDSYDDSNLQIVTRTKNSNGFVRIKDTHNNRLNFTTSHATLRGTFSNYAEEDSLNFQKYKNSRNDLQSVLTGQSNIYGLHFMDYPISMDNLITADKVTINSSKNKDIENKTYYNYQMPQGSINFNLKKKGYVNFFAGTYYRNNNSFFALSEIFRDENEQITNIKEISKIYANPSEGVSSPNPYIYQYAGEATPSGVTNNDLLFDTTWIAAPTICQNALYYFEFPMNPGEYALGAEEGRTGAYLIYLDIGAANKTVDTTVITEKYEITTNYFEIPKGIDFYSSLPPSDPLELESIQGGDIAAIIIPNNARGIITFSLTDSILTCGPPSISGTITSSFQGVNISIIDNNDQPIAISPLSTEIKTIDKVTTYYFKHEDNTFYYEIVTETRVQGETPVRTEFVSEIEENVPENPYEGIVEYNGLLRIISGFTFYSEDSSNITIDLVYDPRTNVYVINFSSDSLVDIDIFITVSDTPITGYTIKVGSPEGQTIAANQTYIVTVPSSPNP